MVDKSSECMVIHSIGPDGRRFRPSDWIERISSSVAGYGNDRRLHYDKLVHPVMLDDEKCLFVSAQLEQQAPQLYAYIMDFVAANQLQVEHEHCQEEAVA